MIGMIVDGRRVDLTRQWKLAESLVGKSNVPENSLETVFQKTLVDFEAATNQPAAKSLKDRAWTNAKETLLPFLKDAFFLEFNKQILAEFTTDQIDQMLTCQKETGKIPMRLGGGKLQCLFHLHKDSIAEVVQSEADKNCGKWIFDALNNDGKEGAKFGEHKMK